MRKLKLLLVAAALAMFAALPAAALAKSHDRDHDGMPDKWEKAHGLSTKRNDANKDPDRDGLSNIGEFRSGTNPRDADSDNDGIKDGDEDADHDGVDNRNEIREHTNPRRADTDGDGIRDGAEDADHDGLNNAAEDRTGNDPIDPDSDDDGVRDGNEAAGTVVSFDKATGVLTISAGARTLSGTVTSATRIECETADEQESAEEHHSATHARPVAERHGADDAANSEAEHNGDANDVCTADDLAPNVVVHEAKLNAQGVFTKVEILK